MSEPQEPDMGGSPIVDDAPIPPSAPQGDEFIDGQEMQPDEGYESPEQELQSLSSKVAALYRKYNGGRQTPDVDLAKYIAGTINSAVSDGLTQDQCQEIVDSFRDDVEDDTEKRETLQQQAPEEAEQEETPQQSEEIQERTLPTAGRRNSKGRSPYGRKRQ